ncbi:hypothetical protein ASD54_22295 [Rhizobium sp. Root149]|nr:hypothetical protein ASD54_22295 [Rhizobium sp. Root149]
MSTESCEARNYLLREIEECSPKEVESQSLRFEPRPGQLLLTQGQVAEWVLFPTSGLISCFRSLGHRRVEVQQVGCDGVLGLHVALTLTGREESTTSIVQTAGQMVGLPPRLVRLLILNRPPIGEILHNYLLGQALETHEVLTRATACSIVTRLAFWIVRADARLNKGSINITHDALSDIHCVRRPSMTVALQQLEGMGAIRSLRGQIVVLDREVLREAAEMPVHGKSLPVLERLA